ncbi:MAG: hypothetical protein CMH57_08625 [Myxococcales bacterium]|nr:hypothetical protein [Myxococcales bacterium]
MSRLGPIALVALLGGLAVGCDAASPPPSEPPLMPLAYTESPSYTPELARELEDGLLTEFSQTNQIPTAPDNLPADVAGLGRVDNSILEDIIESDIDPKTAAARKKAEEAKASERKRGKIFKDPNALAEAVFEAIVAQDQERYEQLFIGPGGLRRLVGVGEETAERRTAALRRSAQPTFDLFKPGNPSEEPEGGLVSKLALLKVEIGKAGTLEGKTPRRNDETVQYWGTTIQFEVRVDPPKDAAGLERQKPEPITFAVTLGRMLLAPESGWKLAEAPKVSADFKTYLEAGLHLKPEMMEPEHHPFPLSVGNFWLYRLQRPDEDDPDNILGMANRSSHTLRVEVADVERYIGYRVVTIRRIVTRKETNTQVEYLLVTPRRVYPCGRYCKSRSNELKYVLDFIRQNAPTLLFPLKPGMGWTYGGELVSDKTRYRTEPELDSVAVPVGEFSDTLVILSQTRSGLDTRYFKPGVGVVRRAVRGNTGTRFEDLVDFRILTTE